MDSIFTVTWKFTLDTETSTLIEEQVSKWASERRAAGDLCLWAWGMSYDSRCVIGMFRVSNISAVMDLAQDCPLTRRASPEIFEGGLVFADLATE